MKLRTQVGVMLIAVFGCLVVVSTVVQLGVIFPSYERLESSLARTDADRCMQAIDREVEYVSKFSIDWSVWNDMYEYAEGRNAAFYENNLANKEYFQNLNIPVMMICDSSGKVVYSHVYDPESWEAIALPLLPSDAIPADHSLWGGAEKEDIHGVIMTERAPLLIASRAILHSDESGPAVGRFIVGRFLDKRAVGDLCEQTSVRFHLFPADATLPSEIAANMPALRGHPGEPVVEEASNSVLRVMRLVPTLDPDEVLVLRASVPREITAQGATTIGFGLISLFVAAGCTMLALVFMLQRRVVSPIVTLKEHATSVGSSGNLTARLSMPRNDEVGALATEFDRMIVRLAESQDSLAKACRQAGMADVATGVLHNVGNAMTNATVTVSQLQRGLEQSRVSGLGKAAAMLREHSGDLAGFLTNDPRGRQLPEYFAKLAESMREEQQRLADDARRLQASLDHINEIVRAQQGLAVAPEIVETTQVSHVIAQAELLVRPSYERHKTSLRTTVREDVVIRIDRTRLQQVLVNFLTNALQAVKTVDESRRVVEITAGANSAGKFWIEVRDQGMGFEPAQRERLFAQGYTTRAGGHGLGLHFCAVTVKQMGGSISATSPGPDRGATFRVELPRPVEEARLAA